MKCPMYEELFINTLWGSDWQRYAGLMSQGSATQAVLSLDTLLYSVWTRTLLSHKCRGLSNSHQAFHVQNAE